MERDRERRRKEHDRTSFQVFKKKRVVRLLLNSFGGCNKVRERQCENNQKSSF